jgi:hypothetical protein
MVAISPSGECAALATQRSLAKLGVASGKATAVAIANGEFFTIAE